LAATQLEELARADPIVARLALVQAVALRAAEDRVWRELVPPLDGTRLADGAPLLHGRTLAVDADVLRDVLDRLVRVAIREGVPGAGSLLDDALDALSLVGASIAQDRARVAELAAGIGAEPALLEVFGNLLALPLLQACRERAAPLLEDAPWGLGYCPVCAGWPLLAELCGLGRERWLRCGQCGAGWRFDHHRCAFCGNQEHRTLGYLASEREREARRAETCAGCRGYLKVVSTFRPLDPGELAVEDLSSLELDTAAFERGYGRPAGPGFPLATRVEVAAWRPS
jgi:FdhE protein